MELKTIRQVSVDYGISRRMLCYYEEIGLLKSSRKNNYAYRVYDEDAIKRIQQIIILRKLQIPMKQIKDILNNQNAVAVIEIFKQNISELDEQITALSAVRSILARFVDELHEKADVHLKLDLLNDKTMLAVVSSLTFSENKLKLKEKMNMGELYKDVESFEKMKQKNVRLTYLLPMTFAVAYAISDNPHEGSKILMKKFVEDVNLYQIKPDTRTFGWGNTREGQWVYDVMTSIPDELEVPKPLIKTTFPGGLYATYTSNPLDFDDMYNVLEKWAKNSNEYEQREDATPLEEAINPLTMAKIQNIYEETTQFMYFDFHFPVKPKTKIFDRNCEKSARYENSKEENCQ